MLDSIASLGSTVDLQINEQVFQFKDLEANWRIQNARTTFRYSFLLRGPHTLSTYECTSRAPMMHRNHFSDGRDRGQFIISAILHKRRESLDLGLRNFNYPTFLRYTSDVRSMWARFNMVWRLKSFSVQTCLVDCLDRKRDPYGASKNPRIFEPRGTRYYGYSIALEGEGQIKLVSMLCTFWRCLGLGQDKIFGRVPSGKLGYEEKDLPKTNGAKNGGGGSGSKGEGNGSTKGGGSQKITANTHLEQMKEQNGGIGESGVIVLAKKKHREEFWNHIHTFGV
ncbi:hypothetical protein GYMLUDRAFT_251591 [Collybiopsis luxurians FD-317 M1]|uniref:Uncharacterized protein n=1 Tax=Collybiopsis luxurians FD-317 M1 TaxID=944289 RepID=A0A0D0BQY1_9AGAR|nr:hypothetical protein GYMLUDRAFT_251591 [Collybiopsis luxurians FD-317 M1]